MDRRIEKMRKETARTIDETVDLIKGSAERIDSHLAEMQGDAERVETLAHNAPAVIENIEKDFKEKTRLEDKDIAFLLVCVGLQVLRQSILPVVFAKEHRLSAQGGDQLMEKTVGRVVPKSWHDILFGGVPYDAIAQSKALKEADIHTGLAGTTHRYRTLGHDPVLGWIFGPANILADACTKSDFVTTYAVGVDEDGKKKIIGNYPLGTVGMFRKSFAVIDQDPIQLPTALARQAIHFGSDYFTKQGLPIPFLGSLAPDVAHRFMSSSVKDPARLDLRNLTIGAAWSRLIDLIIYYLHQFLYNEEKDGPRDLYQVRTRKLLTYSNVMTTGCNTLYVAVTRRVSRLDVGGMVETVHRLISDQAFIQKIKRDFLKEELYKTVLGEPYSFMTGEIDMSGRKMYKKGLAEGLQASEGWAHKQAEGLAAVRGELGGQTEKLTEKVTELGGHFASIYDYLDDKENAARYHLSMPMDLKELEEPMRQLLVSVLYRLARDEGPQVTEEQKEYLRSVQQYVGIANPQTDLDDLSVVGEIKSIDEQKVFYEVALEFLYLREGDAYSDEQEEFLEAFSLNKKQRATIEENVARMYHAIGPNGIAERYGAAKVIVKSTVISTDGVDLRQRAEDAYLRYDIKEALPFFNLLAEQGDGRACYFLGKTYTCGYQGLVKCDVDKAKAYYEQGAAAGDVLCQLKLADVADTPEQQEALYDDAFGPALSLAEAGDIYAMFEVGRIFLNIEEEEQAIYWYELAANAGHWRAAVNLGHMYEEKSQYEKAAKYYQKAADCGDELGLSALANLYFYGKGVSEDENKAVELYQKAAELGEPNAQWFMGIHYFHEKEYGISRDWLERVVESGDWSACYHLARTYYYGNFSKVNAADGLGHGLDHRDCQLFFLLCGAEYEYISSIIELAAQCDRKMFERLFSAGKLQRFDGEIQLGDAVFEVTRDVFSDPQKRENLERQLMLWAGETLKRYAEEGNAAAQYYLGAICCIAGFGCAVKKLSSLRDDQYDEVLDAVLKAYAETQIGQQEMLRDRPQHLHTYGAAARKWLFGESLKKTLGSEDYSAIIGNISQMTSFDAKFFGPSASDIPVPRKYV